MKSRTRARCGTNDTVSRLAKFDVVSIEDLETSDIERVFALADGFARQLAQGDQITTAAGLIMATLFYEPSTRTRLSFESVDASPRRRSDQLGRYARELRREG